MNTTANSQGEPTADMARRREFSVEPGRRYRLRIDATDEPARVSPRGLIGKVEFFDAHGQPIAGLPEGSVQTDRHGAVAYLPTHAAGEAGEQLSGNIVMAPAGAARLRVQVRNWKCSADVVIHAPVELIEQHDQELARYEFPLSAHLPHVLELALRSIVRHARAAILAFQYLDADGNTIEGPYEDCISSPRFGPFRYLRGTVDGELDRIPVLPPPGAARVRFVVHHWKVGLADLSLLGVPRLATDIPDGLDAKEWTLLPSREWSEPYPLPATGEGLVHLAADCIGIERHPGASPSLLVDFIDDTGRPVTGLGVVQNVDPSIVIDAASRPGRRGGFFHRPAGTVAARLKVASGDAWTLLGRGPLEMLHVPVDRLPGPSLVSLGGGESHVERRAASSLWKSRIEFDGFAMDADAGDVTVELTLLDAAGKHLNPKGILLQSNHATVTTIGNVLRIAPHARASGTGGVVRFATSVTILPPRGTAVLATALRNERAQGLAFALDVAAYDKLESERVVPESIADILAMDERSPAKIAQLAESYLQRHGQEPRVLSHLIDACRRIGESGRMETAARRALALKGQGLGRLHTKARHALALLRELDPHWLPTAGLGAPVANRPGQASQLRVAHLFKTTVPVENTGGAIRCLNIVNFQRRIGMRPLVVTPLGYPDAGGTGAPWEQETIDGVPYFRLNGIGRQGLRSVTSTTQLEFTAMLTARLLGEQGVDIVQASSGYRGYEQALVGLAVSRALGVPFVYEVRSYHEHTWRGMTDWLLEAEHTKRRIAQENRCMREADAVVTICETMKQGLVERGISADKVFVVPNSVDLEKFQVAPPDGALQAQLGLGDDIVAGYISNVSEREGHHVLLRAVAQARASGIGMKCLIVGAGPQLESLRTLAAQLGIVEHVVFTGEVAHEQVPAYYALIDIFVVPRVGDFASDFVTPMKPFEAMAMRRPLVVSDRPALQEIVGVDGQRGLVFRAGDHLDLAARLLELAHSPSRREALAEQGWRWIESERSWDRTIRIYDQVYSHAKHAAMARFATDLTSSS
ncbi:glycosyltransferase [Luteimonas viscosa]|uniref:Glycosyltransferase n=1 Tax=Luteimonas viscosa TaxID=1132694 RepID=A0A5D4XRD4_9GAMM|nr:glycosyltransferase family 4 protein [Luteimonas viscosa]TYT27129.1 glycosyltransferase [Luteimonas viscosa]